MTPELKPAFRVLRRKVLTGLAVGMIAGGATTIAVSHDTLIAENSRRDPSERTLEGFMRRESTPAEKEVSLTSLIGELIFIAGGAPLLLKLLKETKPPQGGLRRHVGINLRNSEVVSMEPIPVES